MVRTHAGWRSDYGLATVLNGRIYRAAFIPLLFALVIAGFSLTERAGPLGSSLAPEAFDGERAFAELEGLAARYPERRPGGVGDRRLAGYVARTLRALGGTARGGFSVTTRTVQAQTIDGERTLTTVIAQRPGTTGEAPIVLLAHRDAAGAGGSPAKAQLSGTAVLLELARVLATSETQRTIVLVSTSGGSGGNAGAADFAEHLGELASGGWSGGPIDAALVLGDLAGRSARTPLLGVLSDGPGSAPALLQSTVSSAIAQQTGMVAGTPGTLVQLAHMIFPLAPGEQAPLNAHGVPAVLVGLGGERPPPPDEPVSEARLEGLGRAVLAAVYALDQGAPGAGGTQSGPSGSGGLQSSGVGGAQSSSAEGLQSSGAGGLQSSGVGGVQSSGVGGVQSSAGGSQSSASGTGGPETDLPIHGRQAIPAWALRLLVAALLLPVLAVLGDGFARLRRRREPVGRGVVWALACALPFLLAGLFAILLGRLGAIPAPYPPVSAAALPFDRVAVEAVFAVALVLVLAWLAWPALLRRVGLPTRPGVYTAGGPKRRGVDASRSSRGVDAIRGPKRRGVVSGNGSNRLGARGVGRSSGLDGDVAEIAPMLVLSGLAVVVWVVNPLTALLLVPALHLWLMPALFEREIGDRPAGAPGLILLGELLLIALGALPLALLVAYDAGQLHLGPGGVVHTALLLLAGGRIGVVGAALWSVACGCFAAALLVVLAPPRGPAGTGSDGPDDGIAEPDAITIRGIASYAGPGSLGGTESALR